MELYRDKSKIFNCDVKVEGAKLSDTKARLVLEFNDGLNLIYFGTIDSGGNCKVDIPPLKNITEENTGKCRLEVIAESTYFEPWTDVFNVKRLKQVTVEVKEPKPVVESTINVTACIADFLPLYTDISDYKDYLKEHLEELKQKTTSVSNEIKGISILTGVELNEIQKFIKENKLDKRKLLTRLRKSNITERMNFANKIFGYKHTDITSIIKESK